jgi:1-deoxy-D-xylulose-5-phosphate reductoisomerase
MGKKISIDSSTLMNKILELIEAQKLFNISKKKLDILIHPNSLVHAIIEFKNGLTKFLYHETSMIIPLANAIFDGNLNKKFYKKK